jgi:hypothetical protein
LPDRAAGDTPHDGGQPARLPDDGDVAVPVGAQDRNAEAGEMGQQDR